ncbi:MAG: hypothetical protein HY323_19275 [Betaproteobacteria bacterium]|nr:hypothetical protein [Betaproteobacteria bacterium]
MKMPRAAPHRVMFFGGVLQGMAAAAWWPADLTARYLPVYRGARADGRPG